MRSVLTWGLLFGLIAMSAPLAAGTGQVLGAGVGDTKVVPIAKLLADPEAYVGQQVKVRGAVTDVCPRAGCWIDIGQGKNTIRFKVNDGEIVFTKEMRGDKVVAEGVLTRMELTHEQAVDHARHLAEEKGEAFDAQTVTGPMKIYQIQGTGAVVK